MDKAAIILVYGISVSALLFAKRWKNQDPSTGDGLAGWGLVGLFIISIILIVN